MSPHAGAADFDDSAWERIDPTTIEKRRADGRLCFNWYRIKVTIPERIGAFDTAGSTVVLDCPHGPVSHAPRDRRSPIRRDGR